MNSATKEDPARVVRTQLRDLHEELSLAAKQTTSPYRVNDRSGTEAKKDGNKIDKNDWLDTLESRITHLESVVASLYRAEHDCGICVKTEFIEWWLSTTIDTLAANADSSTWVTTLALGSKGSAV